MIQFRQVTFRFPLELWQQVKRAADGERLTVTDWLIRLLEQSFNQEPHAQPAVNLKDSLQPFLQPLQQQIDQLQLQLGECYAW
ncbi:MAG: hypothetical protein HC919_05505 [Oscillatoriales cyanobacterium SM2_2_1]|nr:hypothetical protein [Oscillatoriales cyanobacterium SM2_2_1]